MVTGACTLYPNYKQIMNKGLQRRKNSSVSLREKMAGLLFGKKKWCLSLFPALEFYSSFPVFFFFFNPPDLALAYIQHVCMHECACVCARVHTYLDRQQVIGFLIPSNILTQCRFSYSSHSAVLISDQSARSCHLSLQPANSLPDPDSHNSFSQDIPYVELYITICIKHTSMQLCKMTNVNYVPSLIWWLPIYSGALDIAWSICLESRNLEIGQPYEHGLDSSLSSVQYTIL